MVEKIHRNSLQPNYKLHWYRIKKILGQGGFGITYLAHDFNLDEDVAIKEYLPIELAVRENDCSVHPVSENHDKNFKWGLSRFIEEARTLAKFKHPNIVRVRSVFEENNTAYMVMEFEKGDSLQDILSAGKTLEEAALLKTLIPLMGGLQLVHKAGFIHRDIKPANIFIREDQSPVLLDFGSARAALGEETKTLTSLVSPGYAPFEQYYSKSDEQGPWTDIYGLAATMYRAITGRAPLDAVDRSKAILNTERDTFVGAEEVGVGKYSERFLKAVDRGLKFKQKERPQTIEEWKGMFEVPPEQPAAVTPEQVINQEEIVTEVVADSVKREDSANKEKSERGDTKQERGEAEVTRGSSTGRWVLGSLVLIGLIGYAVYQKAGLRDPQDEQSLASPELNEKPVEQTAGAAQAELKKQALVKAEQRRTAENEARVKEEQEIRDLFSQAEEDIRANRLTSPANKNALYRAQQIEQLKPGHSKANEIENKIVDKYVALAKQAGGKGEYDKAFIRLDKAENILPDAENIQFAREALMTVKQQKEEQQRLAEKKREAGKAERKRQAALEAQRKQEAPSTNSLAVEMVNIPSGIYLLGSDFGENNEKPVHAVGVKAFRLAKYELSVGQFRKFVEASGYKTDAEKNTGGEEGCYAWQDSKWDWRAGYSWHKPGFEQTDNHPAVCLSWNDAEKYIAWLNRETGAEFRLPSEAEWEYACRSGGKSQVYCGGSNLGDLAWYNSNSGSKTHSVGQKAPNGLGLYDMSGNVWEWTEDCYSSDYNGAPADGSAWLSGNCNLRVGRGGSWYSKPRGVRAAHRYIGGRAIRSGVNGFRLAQDN